MKCPAVSCRTGRSSSGKYLEQEERRRLEYYRNIDLRVLLLDIEDSDRAERLLEWASRTADAEAPDCEAGGN